jgi:GT2 family glycosyltransferase
MQDPDSTRAADFEPLVWVVVLHYQDSDCTSSCLESLRQLNWRKVKVLLVDNGSPDRSGPEIASKYPEFTFLSLPENLGFAGGCNAAVKYCQDRKAEWVWLLNNDTKVSPDSLRLLMEQAITHPEAAALGAMVYMPDGESYVACGIGEIDFRRAKTLMRKAVPPGQQVIECEWLSGCNLLLKTAPFAQVRGFDEEYFLYFEDTDLCVRLREAGYQCLLVPGARIEHIGGASTQGSLSTWRSYYYTRNRLLFFMRTGRGIKGVPAFISIYGHLARHCLVLPFRGENGRRQLKAELLGLRDFHKHQLGKATCLDW